MDNDISFQIRPAARAAGVGETTLRSWIKDGMLPVSVVNGVRLIKRADLEALLDSHRRP
jgi:predicted site-specific integrase-resolvase